MEAGTRSPGGTLYSVWATPIGGQGGDSPSPNIPPQEELWRGGLTIKVANAPGAVLLSWLDKLFTIIASLGGAVTGGFALD